jgi:hypothetical protein
MDIKDEGYTLTQVPGIEYIKVEPSEGSEYSVHVVIKFSYTLDETPPWSFGLDELQELTEALEHACRLAGNMANANGRSV